MTRRPRARRGARRLATLVAATGLVAAAMTPATSPAVAADRATVRLVTLEGAGVAGYDGPRTRAEQRGLLLALQDEVLARVGVDEPLYRWTTALNGFAVRLDEEDVRTLETDPHVVSIEEDGVLPLAAAPGHRVSSTALAGPARRGGAGLVVGVVDTGIWPESPLFSSTPGLGRLPDGFRGGCDTGPDWDRDDCNDKLVAARWFVAGFGEGRVRSTSSLSARDDSGHGTQVASIAAGNSGVSVGVPGLRVARFSGVAPQARVAAYKACWTAPDPADDGCATADVVTAIDRATRDGVDVLTLAVGGSSEADTVDRALLGAAERGIVVVAAAGNRGGEAYAAGPSPWVTTVGGANGEQRRGVVDLGAGPALEGAMASSRAAGPARLVVASRVPAAGTTRQEAGQCRPGSLDVARTRGAIVLCERGGIGRVAKSAAVAQADGVGMVLANTAPGSLAADLHAVPTVHVGRAEGDRVRAWSAAHPHGRLVLRPDGDRRARTRVTGWSSGGDPTGPVVKPDLVAPAVGLLGAVPPGVRSTRWDFLTGTSASAAWTSGVALRLLSRHDWPAVAVRSALATSATSVAGPTSVLRQGAGLLRPARADAAPLAYLVRRGDYRAWLDGSLDGDLNVPSVLLTGERDTARRTVTNVTGRALYFSSRASGFDEHRVTVTPAAVRLGPGESATFRVSVAHDHDVARLDDGWVTWRSGDGRRTRIPVVLSR